MGFIKRNDQHMLQKHLEGKRGPRKHSTGKKKFLKADHKISTLLPDEPEQPEKQINKQTQKDLAQPGVKEVVGEEVCADVPPKISGRIFKGRDALILRPNTPDPESETQCCCEKCTAPSPQIQDTPATRERGTLNCENHTSPTKGTCKKLSNAFGCHV